MRKEIRNGLTAIALGTVTALGLGAVENQAGQATESKFSQAVQVPSQNNELNELQKVGVTFLGAAWIAGVAALGYRLSDGAKEKEKYVFLIFAPAGNFVGTSLLLAEMWR